FAQGIDIKNAAIAGTRFARHLTRRLVGHRALAEDHDDAVLAYRVDDLSHLPRRSLLVGVDRPEIEFPEAEIAREVAEGAFARHQPSFVLRYPVELGTDRLDGRRDLGLV